ncbi:MFS transporter [Escherichia coli]|nr:permease [Escherichia coli]
MTTIGLVSIIENPYIAVLLISIGGFSHQLLSTVAATLGADLFKKNEVATAVGMAGACAWSGQLIFNLFIGAFVSIIGFGPFFIALAVFDLIGAVALWILIKDNKQTDDHSHNNKLISSH